MKVINKTTRKEHDAIHVNNNEKEVMDFICFDDKEKAKTGDVYDTVDEGDYVVHETIKQHKTGHIIKVNMNYKETAFNDKYKIK